MVTQQRRSDRERVSALATPNQHRGYVHRRFNMLRLLRNRTMHHEPIWNGMIERKGRVHVTHPLADLYADILDAIGWTSPRLRDSVVTFDRFPDTLASGPTRQIREIQTFLGL